MKTVTYTEDQFKLVERLLNEYFDRITSQFNERYDNVIAYGAIISTRRTKAEKAWNEYCEEYDDPNMRAWTKEEFFKENYMIDDINLPQDETIKMPVRSGSQEFNGET